MANADFRIDAELFDSLIERMKEYQGNTEAVINEVLWEQGGELINEAIMLLLPRSGRNWSGKKKAAKDAAPFTQTNENLSVTVHTKYAYHYLYFPDDGSTTRKHVGNQQFMFRGAENEQGHIIDLCIAKLIEKMEG